MMTQFSPPAAPAVRNGYRLSWTQHPTRPGCWDTTSVTIARYNGDGTQAVAAEYQRGYPGVPPHDVFRQRGPDGTEAHFALCSPDYQETAVIDLGTGAVIAAEDRTDQRWGFCPVGFYVPDWHDVHDRSIMPGSKYWRDSYAWPDGTLGFVWGCYWGEDFGWKVQCLDLSRVAEGIVMRDERFGYVPIETGPRDTSPSEFIQVHADEGNGPAVTFRVPRQFHLISGEEFDVPR